MRVAYHQLIVLADLQSAGLAGITLRRSPISNEITVAIKDLDSSRLVNDEDLILLVDRDRTGLDEPSVIESLTAPNV